MKAVILAGGLGTRISEETHLKPKPMIEIGGKPILWHIMKSYSFHGINEFIVCCGYKGYVIKEYFANYFLHMSDVTFDMSCNQMVVHQQNAEPWRVTLIDTGEETMTGGRLNAIQHYIKGERFLCTYGDGLSDINLRSLLAFHSSHGKLATVTAVRPITRFGALETDANSQVLSFSEKPRAEKWINGGFFIFEPEIFQYLHKDSILEREPLERVASDGQLKAFMHEGFWQPMDTYREMQDLNSKWNANVAPWKNW